MPPNPPAKRIWPRDMQISKSQKKYSWPSPSQILGMPLLIAMKYNDSAARWLIARGLSVHIIFPRETFEKMEQ